MESNIQYMCELEERALIPLIVKSLKKKPVHKKNTVHTKSQDTGFTEVLVIHCKVVCS
jgi:hypothetical protein